MNDGKDKINIYHTIRRGHRGPTPLGGDGRPKIKLYM